MGWKKTSVKKTSPVPSRRTVIAPPPLAPGEQVESKGPSARSLALTQAVALGNGTRKRGEILATIRWRNGVSVEQVMAVVAGGATHDCLKLAKGVELAEVACALNNALLEVVNRLAYQP